MSIAAIGGVPANHAVSNPSTVSRLERGETGPDHDGDSDDTAVKGSNAPAARFQSGPGGLVNLVA